MYYLFSTKDFFSHVEQQRAECISKLLMTYNMVGPILRKLEGLVLQTSTGKSSLMAFFYDSCEKKTFNTLIKWVTMLLKIRVWKHFHKMSPEQTKNLKYCLYKSRFQNFDSTSRTSSKKFCHLELVNTSACGLLHLLLHLATLLHKDTVYCRRTMPFADFNGMFGAHLKNRLP